MLPEMSIAATSSSGTSSDAKCVIVCGRPSSDTWNADCGMPRTNLPWPSLTVTVTCTTSTSTLLGVADRLGPHRLHDASAAGERADGANLVLGDSRSGVPLALERRSRERAHLPAVDEERHARRRILWIRLRAAQQRRAGDVGIRGQATRILSCGATAGAAPRRPAALATMPARIASVARERRMPVLIDAASGRQAPAARPPSRPPCSPRRVRATRIRAVAHHRQPVGVVGRPDLVDEVLDRRGQDDLRERGGRWSSLSIIATCRCRSATPTADQAELRPSQTESATRRAASGANTGSRPASASAMPHAFRSASRRAAERRAARSATAGRRRAPVRWRASSAAPAAASPEAAARRRSDRGRGRRGDSCLDRGGGRCAIASAMVSRSASRSANGLISDTLSANVSRSFDVSLGASSTRSKLTRRSASGARPTSRPSSDPDDVPRHARRHVLPRDRPRGAQPQVVRSLALKPKSWRLRHVAGEQHRAVGIADVHGVGDRQQHVRRAPDRRARRAARRRGRRA